MPVSVPKAPARRVTYFGVEVTRRCNLQCPHCFTESGGKAHPGPNHETLGRLLGDLAGVGAETVAFSGGEPLLRDDLEDVMQFGRRLGIRTYTMVTNGYHADSARARSLKEAGLEAVQVSIDGVDARDHVAVRGCLPTDFYRALRAVRVFREAGVTVDIATIICKSNVSRAAEMLVLGEALGVRSVRYCSFVPTGRAADPQTRARFHVQPPIMDEFLALLRGVAAAKDSPVNVVIDHGIGPWTERGEFHCDAGESVAYISAEGDLYPCPGSIFPPFKVGNLYETALEQLLSSPRMATVRCITRDQLTEPCKSCPTRTCSGGCRGAAYATTGNVRAAPTYCNLLRRMRSR